MKRFKPAIFGVVLTLCWGASDPAEAHWCSNIWTTPARIVVKPEKSTVFLSAGKAVKLRVYLQNNFPYRLYKVQMRGQASGYQIQAAPAQQDVFPGQNAGYLLTITKSSGSATVPVSSLNLQIKFRPNEEPYGWMGSSNTLLGQTPSQSLLLIQSKYDSDYQDASLAASTLSAKFPGAKLPGGKPFFGRTGLQQVIHWFGYRFCYSSSGGWRCGGQQCPSPCKEGNAWGSMEQFPQNCMRAAVEVAAWHARGKLGSELTNARNAAVNAIKGGGSAQHRCLAAVVGGYLWQGATSSALIGALNGLPAACKKAGLRAFDGSNSSSCASGLYYERAACAAAEGLRGNDGPIKGFLKTTAGDGASSYDGNDDSSGYKSLYSSYMLFIVTAHWLAKTGKVTYYPDAGTSSTTKKDTGGAKKDTGGTKKDTKPQPGKEAGTPSSDGAVVTGDSVGDAGEEDSGCSCLMTRSEPAPIPLLVLMALLALGRLRRRR